MPIRVALAEDKPFLARAIQDSIDLYPEDLEFCFHAPDGRRLLERLDKHAGVDAILMDIEMPELDGITATTEVCARFPHIKVIMLTVFDDDQRIFQAIAAGAMGYLLKDEPAAVIRNAVLDIMNGGAPMSPAIAARTLGLLRDPARARTAAPPAEDFDLTPREVDVLEQLSHGLSYQEIATNLFISPATVRKHIEHIYRKLQVNNKLKAVKKATRHGLIG